MVFTEQNSPSRITRSKVQHKDGLTSISRLPNIANSSPYVCSTDAVSNSSDSEQHGHETASRELLQNHGRKVSLPSTTESYTLPLAQPLLQATIGDNTRLVTASDGATRVSLNVTFVIPPHHDHPLILRIELPDDIGTPPTAAPTLSLPLSQPSCKFLTLPRELRDQIYTNLHYATHRLQPGRLNLGYANNFNLSAAFLRTCKQIHAEARGKNRSSQDRTT
jgi:hypothetical protein